MPNGNDRGNTRNRRRRKLFLLNKFGDGSVAPCHECGTTVDYGTMVVDRIVPHVFGGRYTDDNIAVHCHKCSNRQGSKLRMTLFKNDTHKDIWIEHNCERCYHGLDCPILAKALTTNRKPSQWERKPREQLMARTIKCNSFTKSKPKPEKLFEDVPMFDVQPQDVAYLPVEGMPNQPRKRPGAEHA